MNFISSLRKKNKRGIIVALVLGILWSWLFLVDVGNLAGSTTLGFVLMLVAYAVMVAISVIVVLNAWPFIAKRLRVPSYKSLLYIVVIWAAVEFLLAWLVSVVWMGREGSWDNIVPFVSLTPMVVLTPLKYLTRLFGFFGTSAVVGTGVLIIIASITQKKWRKLTSVYWLAVITVNVLLWLAFTTASGPRMRATITSEHLGEPQKINPGNSEIILVPEYGLDESTNENLADRFTDNSREVFITGTKQYGETSGNSNVLIYGSNKQGFIYEHQKSRLIVGGEYLPFSYEVLTRAFAPDVYTDFQVRRAVSRGEGRAEPFRLPSGVLLGNAACSSIINPNDYRMLTKSGASVLANSASLEIFRGSRVFALHHDGLAKFMAVANARPFLQSANNWKAFALDHNGNTTAQVQPVGQASVDVESNTKKTPYTYIGEWLVYAGFIVLLYKTVTYVLAKLRKK